MHVVAYMSHDSCMASCKDDTHKCTNCALAQGEKSAKPLGSSAATCFVMVAERWSSLLLVQLAFLVGAGFAGFDELKLAANKEMEPNDAEVYYKALMNLQCSKRTCEATMNLQGNNNEELDEKKCSWEATYFQDKVNVKDNDICEAIRYSQNEKVDNNGDELMGEKLQHAEGLQHFEQLLGGERRRC